MTAPQATGMNSAATAVPLMGERQARRHTRTATSSGRWMIRYIYFLWALIIFDPHRWLASMGAGPLNHLGAIAFIPLVLLMLVQGPMIVAWAKSWSLYPALLAYIGFAAVTVPLAYHRGTAYETVQGLLLFYLLGLGTLVYIRKAEQAIPIMLMFLFQFAWWAYHARFSAMVFWHPGYANTDGVGSLLVMGIGICFYYGMAAENKWMKRLGYALAAYCILGVVASFARGAVLTAGAVLVILWVRSPRKGLAAAGAVVAVLLAIGGQAMLHERGAFWAEMESTFTENIEQGTGRDRWELWKAATRVWQERPIIGVGARNFGPFAASYFAFGEIPGYENPGRLYGRNLHNAYFQILSEFGIVGSLLFIWLVVDFWKRNRALRRPDFLQAWHSRTGGRYNLGHVSLGLELAMFAFLCNSLFYAQLYVHWLYTLLIVNFLLWAVSMPSPADRVAAHRTTTSRWGSFAPRPPMLRHEPPVRLRAAAQKQLTGGSVPASPGFPDADAADDSHETDDR
jgi:O-antigen ligase